MKNLPALVEIETGYNKIESFVPENAPALKSIDLINNQLVGLTLNNPPHQNTLGLKTSF